MSSLRTNYCKMKKLLYSRHAAQKAFEYGSTGSSLIIYFNLLYGICILLQMIELIGRSGGFCLRAN